MALGLRPLPGPRTKPGLRPRHKPNRQVNGHKLGAMAQDIRYPGVRVGEACGPQTARLARLRDAKVMLTITIPLPLPLPYGIKPLCLGHGHGHGLGLGHGTRQISKGQGQQANGHKLVAMAQDIRYPWLRVGEACGPGVAS